MQHTPEATAVLPSGIELSFDTFGERDDPALLLIMGLSGPLNWWDPDLCSALAEQGFYVIRYDNRDIGKSTRLRGQGGRRTDLIRGYTRVRPRVPYTLSDLADDAIGLLDHLGIKQAHVTGVSMGGMIAQTLAIEHPERVLTLVSIMSTTGRRTVGWNDPRLIPLLLGRSNRTREALVARSVHTWRVIGSPAYPTPPDKTRQRAHETFDRGLSPSGVVRQMQAILAQPDRTAALGSVTVPVLVIHGLADRLVHVSGGRATARAIPGAELMLIPGMGHDLPEELWPAFVDGILRTAARSAQPASRANSSSSSSASRM